jgi:hypothetical protein
VSPPRLLSRGATRASATAGLTSLPSSLGSLSGDRLGVLEILVGGAPGEPGETVDERGTDQIFFTAWACGPLGPWVTSNSTWSPSFRDLKPDAAMAE